MNATLTAATTALTGTTLAADDNGTGAHLEDRGNGWIRIHWLAEGRKINARADLDAITTALLDAGWRVEPRGRRRYVFAWLPVNRLG